MASLHITGLGRIAIDDPDRPPCLLSLAPDGWREGPAGSLLWSELGVHAGLAPRRDGRFVLWLEAPGPYAGTLESALSLAEAWRLLDGPRRRWLRRKATEVAIFLSDQASRDARRGAEIIAELALLSGEEEAPGCDLAA